MERWSAPQPELILYGNLIHAADTSDAFADAVESALAAGPKARQDRMQAMAKETWPEKLEKITRNLAGAHPADNRRLDQPEIARASK